MSDRDSRHLCFYLSSDHVGGMEHSVATVIAGVDPGDVVTVMGVTPLVVETVARGRPGTRIEIVPDVASRTDIRSLFALSRAVGRLRPDLFVASMAQLFDGQYGIIAARLNGVPAVGVVHSIFRPHRRSQHLLFRLLMGRTQGLGGVSQFVCRQAESILGMKPGSVTLLYNGVPDRVVDGSVRTPDGMSTDHPVIGAVGRLVPEKGFDLLIRAMAALPDAHLVLIGDGPERNSLERLAVESRVRERITFSGWEVAPLTRRARFDVVAVPSRVEGFGLVAVEALLAEMPVVAARVGGLAEVVDDGISGLLVPVEDHLALACALGRVLADPGLASAMATRGRREMLARFSISSMNKAYDEFFTRGISRPLRPTSPFAVRTPRSPGS